MDPSSTTRQDRALGAHSRSGISFAPNWRSALDKAVSDVMADSVSAPDLLVVFVSAAWHEHYAELIDDLRHRTGAKTLIGCSCSGVIAGASCHESAPGISLLGMWMPGVVVTPRVLDGDPTEWPWGSDVSVASVRGILMFAEPFRIDAQSILVGVRDAAPQAQICGALASTSLGDHRAWVFLDDDVLSKGAVALTIEGPYDLVTCVSQGGTPVGEPWTVTEVDHNRIITISNRPAMDVVYDTVDELVKHGLTYKDLLAGFPMSEYQDTFSREDFVARGVLATDVSSGSIVVGCLPRVGQTIQFLEISAEKASRDLAIRLDDFVDRGDQVVGGIVVSCKGRGTTMFGRNDHDAAAVASALPDVPTAGLYSSGEIGPVSGVPAYNAFALCLGMIVKH